MSTQISTQAGRRRSWMPTCWWSRGRDKVTTCPPTAPCPNTWWTSRGFISPGRSRSSPTTTTPSGACLRVRTRTWPAWGTWTGRGPSWSAAGGWSAPSTLWFTGPSDRRWTGTLAVDWESRTLRGLKRFWICAGVGRPFKVQCAGLSV